jgi:hypothetical protein
LSGSFLVGGGGNNVHGILVRLVIVVRDIVISVVKQTHISESQRQTPRWLGTKTVWVFYRAQPGARCSSAMKNAFAASKITYQNHQSSPGSVTLTEEGALFKAFELLRL